MAKKKDVPSYPDGPLITKIRIPDPHKDHRHLYPEGPFLFSSIDQKREAVLVEKAMRLKIPVLLQYFRIAEHDPDKWEKLALSLAAKHVPGFQFMRNRGAPVKEFPDLISRYYRYFNKTKVICKKGKTRKIPDGEVCKFLVKDPEFDKCFPTLANNSPRRLGNLISKARKMRRERVMYDCHHFKLAKAIEANPELFAGYVASGPPPWCSIYKSKLLEKYQDP